MNVSQAIQNRKSVRAFLDKPVGDEKITQLLDIARCAPSGSNTQPWQVAVLREERKKYLQQKLEQVYREGESTQNDYTYYPVKWVEPYQSRRKACGLQLYSSVNIDRQDKHRRTVQWVANYHSFDAPVVLLFFMDNIMETGSYIDYGMFLQSFMLAATEEGLATCAQAALCDYSDVIRRFLGYSQDKTLVCGIALGYEDTDAAINDYRTPREPVSSFTQFFD